MKRKLMVLLSIVLSIVCISGCTGTPGGSEVNKPDLEETLVYTDVSSGDLSEQEQSTIDSLFFENDIGLAIESADPACVYGDDGYYYLYGTGHNRFNCYRSRDLANWESQTDAFKQPKNMNYSEVSSIMTQTEFNNYKNNTWLKYDFDWAPGVIYDEDLDLYLMFFSARYTNATPVKLQISLAVSKSAKGPYIQWTGKVNGANGDASVNSITYANGQTVPAYNIGYGDVFIDFERLNGINGNYPYEGYIKAIDVEPFVDPVTGDKYLFFCRDLGDKYTASCSMGMKMIDWFTPDYSTLTLLTKPNYQKVDNVSQDTFYDEGSVNEGQYVVYNETNGLYYLTYSCNGYTDKSYRVKQAVATSPLGPYTKVDINKGAHVVYTDLSWVHRAGTGHHVFTKVGNELFIIYHMHKSPSAEEFVWPNNKRVIAVDKVVWVENEDGLQVLKSLGPSYDYRLKADEFTGYTNLASKATVTVNKKQSDSNAKFLIDGAIKVVPNDGIREFDANYSQLAVTLSYSDPITLKGIMAYNSHYVETAFDHISKIEVEYTRDGKLVRGTTGEVSFDWDRFYYNHKYNSIPYYIPGCASTALFNDIENVSKIKIYFEPREDESAIGVSIADLVVIGK